jgi:hypothetical protein
MSGFEEQQRLLGHVSNQDIQQYIPHTKGMKELINKLFKQHTKRAACMKSILENYPPLKDGADHPFKQVNIDSFSSSIQSIIGRHRIQPHSSICGCNSGFRLLYGIKTKDDMLKAMKKLYSNIADLSQKHI